MASGIFMCSSCGYHDGRGWRARCPQCGAWIAVGGAPQSGRPLTSFPLALDPNASATVEAGRSEALEAADLVTGRPSPSASPALIAYADVPPAERIPSKLAELDRVLGGGLVAGSLVLLGGSPGAGKTTLLSQALADWCELTRSGAIYITGEESTEQVTLRARRLGSDHSGIRILADPDLDRGLECARSVRPAVLVIDSIQTVRTADLDAPAGSITQIRECTHRLMTFAKEAKIPALLIGHVTKDGALAGPKTLEHLVDVVLELDSDGGPFRTLRAAKNRFGSTQEVGLFEMTTTGLREVANAGANLIAERRPGAHGSAIACVADGCRVQLIEIQALVAPLRLSETGNPIGGKITATGVDAGRVAMIRMILAAHTDVDVTDRDLIVNAVGGRRIVDPAADLAIAAAIASSARATPVDEGTVLFGELGLTGEVRSARFCEIRLVEAARSEFKRAVISIHDENRLAAAQRTIDIATAGVETADEAIEQALRSQSAPAVAPAAAPALMLEISPAGTSADDRDVS